jgi:hypothetical protein
MITKSKGAEDTCPSCKQILVCREVTYKDQTKLQWQYKDREAAHFSFDFATKKSSCKEGSGFAENFQKATGQDDLNISGIEIPQKDKEYIMTETEDGTKRLLVVLSGVKRICANAGITHPATVGMIFNQVCENRRSI